MVTPYVIVLRLAILPGSDVSLYSGVTYKGLLVTGPVPVGVFAPATGHRARTTING